MRRGKRQRQRQRQRVTAVHSLHSRDTYCVPDLAGQANDLLAGLVPSLPSEKKKLDRTVWENQSKGKKLKLTRFAWEWALASPSAGSPSAGACGAYPRSRPADGSGSRPGFGSHPADGCSHPACTTASQGSSERRRVEFFFVFIHRDPVFLRQEKKATSKLTSKHVNLPSMYEVNYRPLPRDAGRYLIARSGYVLGGHGMHDPLLRATTNHRATRSTTLCLAALENKHDQQTRRGTLHEQYTINTFATRAARTKKHTCPPHLHLDSMRVRTYTHMYRVLNLHFFVIHTPYVRL